MRRALSAAVAAAVLSTVVSTAALVVAPGAAAGAISPTRAADPVVLTGANLPRLVGVKPPSIVGFRWTGTAWAQLPVQVDERAVVNFGKVYNNPAASFYGSQVAHTSALVYTSANTWTGVDPDHTFDSNDELAFMARDAGVVVPSGTAVPTGTATGSGVEVHVTDPLAPGNDGYVYLFHKSVGSKLFAGAHKAYVHYTFKLVSGGYKKTFSLTGTDNPENSTVKGATYTRHFSDRWLTDALNVTAVGKTAPDILDRVKVGFAPSVCGRSEDTFDATGVNGPAEGAFIVNKTGPVRAIRSYVGANSGPSTERTHVFYDQREDVVTDLRVHAIPSIMDLVDYSAAASGMTYRNSVNPAGVTIDGSTDSLTAGPLTWEQVTGTQGTVNYVNQMTASFAVPGLSSYYLDSTTPSDTQCTGDAFAYGTSGTYLTSAIPCTDPALGCADSLQGIRTAYYRGAGGTAASAQADADDVLNGLQFATTNWG